MKKDFPSVTRILFIDVVGFSKKPMHVQKTVIEALTSMVCGLDQFRSLAEANRVALPTGDGMAIGFWSTPEVPLACAIGIQRAIKAYNLEAPPSMQIFVRMGINTGEVFSILDINQHRNIVGDGINNAQRVMDFGDSWHILASDSVASDLIDFDESYKEILHFAGIFADKHGMRHQVFNVFSPDFGNTTPPTKNKVSEGDSQPSSPPQKPPRAEPRPESEWDAILAGASWEVQFLQHTALGADHLFLALTKQEESLTAQGMKAQGLDPTAVRRGLRKSLGRGSRKPPLEIPFDPLSAKLLEKLQVQARAKGGEITEADLVRELFRDGSVGKFPSFLQAQGLDIDRFLGSFDREEDFSSQIRELPPRSSPPQKEGFDSTPPAEKHSAEEPVPGNPASAAPREASPTGRGDSSEQTMFARAAQDTVRITLTVEDGPERGKRFEFADPEAFIVGRSSEANFTLSQEDKAISRKHFLVEVVPPRCYLKDFGSLNGTFVNGKRAERVELQDGDRINLGKTCLRVQVKASGEAASRNCPSCGVPFISASSEETVCRACRMERELEKEGRQPKTKTRVLANCRECGSDVSASANSDGLGPELGGVATYLCENCIPKWRGKADVSELGKFRVLRELGKGGMGVVYLVQDRTTCRLGALKRILLPDSGDQFVQRFLREMKIMERLVHPNIVRLFGQDVHQGCGFFVSEFLAGGSIADLLLKGFRGPLPLPVALKITREVLAGLEFFHGTGSVHRDIKPANILLTAWNQKETGIAKLADFGLAKCFTDIGGATLTRPNEFAGSIFYTAPEQILNFKKAGPPADLFSLGVTLYEMISGKFPFDFPTQLDNLKARVTGRKPKDPLLVVLEDPVIPLRERLPDVSPDLAEAVDRAIRKDAGSRFQTAAEFRRALEKVQG